MYLSFGYLNYSFLQFLRLMSLFTQNITADLRKFFMVKSFAALKEKIIAFQLAIQWMNILNMQILILCRKINISVNSHKTFMQSNGFQYLFRFSWLQIFRGFLYYFAKKDIFFVLETKDIQFTAYSSCWLS